MPFNHKELDAKWQKFWEENKTFATPSLSNKPKKYILDMFPYPSAAGLHVGHPKGYTATDIVSRYYHAKGFNVLHPIGFDAFGLPAENFAIKTGTHPAVTTAKNIDTFIKQLKALGFSYDWERMVDTTDPEYYKWTQWIFLELFKKGLAYEQNLPINYCPSCKTGLANEEVLSDNTCERCGTLVERRALRQWVLKITDYAERLIDDLDELDWAESVKEMQRNWIGKSVGCEFELKKSDDETKKIAVYTTRVDTVFGMTYAVMAPDHPHVEDFITDAERANCEKYIAEAKSKSDQDRTQADKEKTGVFTGSYVINPFNHEEVPLYIGDYVLGHYGTGAVMAVPAHDERDFEFAKKYDLPIVPVVFPQEMIEDFRKQMDEEFQNSLSDDDLNTFLQKCEEDRKNFEKNLAYTPDGFIGELPITIGTIAEMTTTEIFENGVEILETQSEKVEIFQEYNREFFGLSSEEAREKFIELAEKGGFGHKKINYKLRDWLFSRQRYWGEPIPLIHLDSEVVGNLPRIYSLEEATDPNLAYVLKSEPKGDENPLCLCSKGKLRELVIGGKIFGKIYNGLSTKIVIDENLPLKLPEMDDFLPAGDGNSPLAKVDDFVNIRLADNLSGKRETNTMPQWGGSCWYYLRYLDPKNPNAIASREILDYWQNVDEYVGGAEHAVLHLLYARFWHKVLYDIGVVPTKEPFQKLVNQGMVLAYAYERKDGGLVAIDLVEERDGKFFIIQTGEEVNRIVAKMSKSLKNTANPLDISEEYGADTLRLYEMAIGDFRDSAPWNPDAIIGVRRFLDKAYALYENGKNVAKDEMKAMKLLHKTIKKVEEDIRDYKFNTAISSMMILVNE